MIWIRVGLLGTPLVLLWLGFASVRSVKLQFAAKSAARIVHGVIEVPERFNPFREEGALAERIEGMLFSRLLEVDGDTGKVTAGLATAWRQSSSVRYFFVSEREAQKALEDVTEPQSRWEEWGVVSLEAVGDELRVGFKGPEGKGATDVLNLLDSEAILPVKLLRANVLQSSWDSYLDFKRTALESGQVRGEWPTGASSFELAVVGDTENFLREFKIYYDSNENLGASYRFEKEIPYLETPELLLTLRDDVFWHDGERFTAADVEFSVDFSRAQSWNPRLRAALGTIQAMAVADDHTLRVIYRTMGPDILETWALVPLLPRHVLNGKDEGWWVEQFERSPIGTGPFQFGERTRDGSLLLARHEPFHLGAPETSELVFLPAFENARRRLRFLSGEIDSYPLQRGEEGFVSKNDEFTFLRTFPGRQVSLVWSPGRSPFDDKALRRALSGAVSIEDMVETVCRGHGTANGSFFHPESEFVGEKTAPRAMPAREKIEGAFDAMGWKESKEGRASSAGKPLKMRLGCDGMGNSRATADYLKLAWEGLGVSVEIVEFPAELTEMPEVLFRDVNADAFIVSFPASMDWFSFWNERGRGVIASALKRMDVEGTRARKLYADLAAESDGAKRIELFRKLEELLDDEEVVRGLFVNWEVRVVQRDEFSISRGIGDGHRVAAELGDEAQGGDDDFPWWVRKLRE